MPQLYRKRLIPEECIHLKDDIILSVSDDYIITKWNTLNPKTAFSNGLSLYVLKKGWKISKFLDDNGNLVQWYCDIISTEYNSDSDSYIFTDLLADVILDSNLNSRVVDLDEFATAFESGMISADEITSTLKKLDELLSIIYDGRFSDFISIIEQHK